MEEENKENMEVEERDSIWRKNFKMKQISSFIWTWEEGVDFRLMIIFQEVRKRPFNEKGRNRLGWSGYSKWKNVIWMENRWCLTSERKMSEEK